METRTKKRTTTKKTTTRCALQSLVLAVAVVAGCGGELVPIHKQASSVPPLVCEDHAECGINPSTLEAINCKGFGEECFALSKCDKPRCVQPGHACEWLCGAGECMLMESFPAQINCR